MAIAGHCSWWHVHVLLTSQQELQRLLQTSQQQKDALALEMCEVRDSLSAVCSAGHHWHWVAGFW